eukprot:946706-Rhodomonas_salina.1
MVPSCESGCQNVGAEQTVAKKKRKRNTKRKEREKNGEEKGEETILRMWLPLMEEQGMSWLNSEPNSSIMRRAKSGVTVSSSPFRKLPSASARERERE